MVNRNIFNSDNYRYLIYLLTPWSLGFGLVMSGLMKRGKSGRVTAFMLLIVMACTVTGTALRWYRVKLHYIDDGWRVLAVSRPAWSNPGLWEVFGLRGSEGLLNYEI